jgi:quinol monooxygenase YgiN
MKRISAISAISLAMFLFSCGNETTKEETQTSADTTAAVAAEPAPAKPAFTPFKVVVIQHKVKDFEKSKQGYFNSDSLRQPYGITGFVMGRVTKDSNTVFVMNKIEDIEKAKAYFIQPKVKEAMKKAGVSSPPGYSYGEVVRLNEDIPATDDRLSITHHVKDYDTWLKAFDVEGTAVRTANGIIDRAIVRDNYDPNNITLIFAVTDLEKAKARVASPELKKIMADAGVDSPPTIRWFKEVK